MMAYWQHLSWSHATFALLAVLLFAGSLWCLRMALRPTVTRKPRSWPLVDYSSQREKMIAQLGDRHLLAKPINRSNVVPFRRAQ